MSKELSIGARVEHPVYGEGIVSRVNYTSYEIFFERKGKLDISKSNDELIILEEGTGETGSSRGPAFSDMIAAIEEVLDKNGALQEKVPLGSKWVGGNMILQPGEEGLKSKEIPIETFFHKIVMVRDRLRVLEQNINSHSKLDDEEKVNLQQYITRAYGSLTSFNVLFSEKEHYFSGQKSK
ncbi:MAG: hypothetical protein C0594_04395 [Marinilabiliales bacterium]|nr:MAG: hypothetical protein C0594_04395 [Marinilabiliales bacterium]